jgi:hypothetical protein
VECHGSFANATCLNCKRECDCDEIREDVLQQRIAYCKECKVGVVKPNIVFFGEDLGDRFHIQMGEDRDKVDLLVVIGSSLKVQPVALIPYNIDPEVPQILINREPLQKYNFDVTLLGNCDDILVALSLAVGGALKEKMENELTKRNLASLKSAYENIQQISVEDFKTLVNEPKAKRRRSEELEDGSSLWESNYALVESRLTNSSYLLVPPSTNVFKGAELYYDRDQDTFCRQPGTHNERKFDDSDDGSTSGSSSSNDSTISDEDDRGGSLPPLGTTENTEDSEDRSASCPPEIDSPFIKSNSPKI